MNVYVYIYFYNISHFGPFPLAASESRTVFEVETARRLFFVMLLPGSSQEAEQRRANTTPS